MDDRGLTLLELIIALAILSILAAAVLPMAEVTVKRNKELELRRSLRILRTAIDAYNSDFEMAVEKKLFIPSLNETGYPESIEKLVEGVDWGGLYPFRKKYLRRIPLDPFDEDGEGWGFRSYSDEPDSLFWGGEDVYDVFSRSGDTALDGTPYNTW